MPRKWTPAIAAKVCESIAAGDSLEAAAGIVGLDKKTVSRHVASDPAFREEYREARRFWAEIVGDDLNKLADSAPAVAAAADETGGNSNAAVAALRLQIDTKKWLLSKLAPHLFGDRLELAGDPDRPLIPPAEIDNSKIASAIVNLLAAAPGGKNHPPVIDATAVADPPALPQPEPALLVDDPLGSQRRAWQMYGSAPSTPPPPLPPPADLRKVHNEVMELGWLRRLTDAEAADYLEVRQRCPDPRLALWVWRRSDAQQRNITLPAEPPPSWPADETLMAEVEALARELNSPPPLPPAPFYADSWVSTDNGTLHRSELRGAARYLAPALRSIPGGRSR